MMLLKKPNALMIKSKNNLCTCNNGLSKRNIMKDDIKHDSQNNSTHEDICDETNECIANENNIETELDKKESQNQIISAENETTDCAYKITGQQFATAQQENNEGIMWAQEFEGKEDPSKEILFKSCAKAYQRACKWNKVLISAVTWIITAALIATVLAVGYYFIHEKIGIAVAIVTGILSVCSRIVFASENKKGKILNSLNEKSKARCFKRYYELYGNNEDGCVQIYE